MVTTTVRTATTDEQPKVLCLDYRTPVTTAASRARRIGAGCWRKRKAKARAAAAPVALPGLSGRGGPGQTGPDLLDDDQDGEDDLR
ncbi:hypothetical protein [Micromonospora sp. NPDC050200]|uniref:hypothetical protein n=1 Tax=Micromonospora sp. NPDC050200 TaxID=3155664 RepID=UPI0033C12E71